MSLRRTDEEIRLQLTDRGKKVDLEQSQYLQLLKETLELSK